MFGKTTVVYREPNLFHIFEISTNNPPVLLDIEGNSTNKKKLKSTDFVWHDGDQFRYELHSLPEEATGSIGTSVLLAAWNAATYVAQIDESRSDEFTI